MEQPEFLEKNVFIDLKNLNKGADKATVHYFSESNFETVLQRVEHFGIGVYKIETRLNGKVSEIVAHDDFKKKATDPKWYKKAFLTSKSRQPGLSYSATYKVSNKLLAKNTVSDNEESN
jgi:hypothetical protein